MSYDYKTFPAGFGFVQLPQVSQQASRQAGRRAGGQAGRQAGKGSDTKPALRAP